VPKFKTILVWKHHTNHNSDNNTDDNVDDNSDNDSDHDGYYFLANSIPNRNSNGGSKCRPNSVSNSFTKHKTNSVAHARPTRTNSITNTTRRRVRYD
jgi:hypothetical protein